MTKRVEKRDPLVDALPPAVVVRCDMPEEMQTTAIQVCQQALIKNVIEKDIACYVKQQFDQQFTPSWQCIVGKNFAGSLTYETKYMILVTFGKMNFLLFKSFE